VCARAPIHAAGAVLAGALDHFDRVQLADVVSVCAAYLSLSAARTLFAQSLAQRTTSNDADRLRKYLARFDLDFETIRAHQQP
jgi:transcriptional regulatory protein RtcR